MGSEFGSIRSRIKSCSRKFEKDLKGKNNFDLLFEIDLILIEWNCSATSTDLETTKTNLVSARTELNRTKSAVADLAIKLNGKINKNTFSIFLMTEKQTK